MIFLSAEQVANFDHTERAMIAGLVRQVEWLTDQIDAAARKGRAIGTFRLQRKALRWALAKLGVELPPNPPIPEAPGGWRPRSELPTEPVLPKPAVTTEPKERA